MLHILDPFYGIVVGLVSAFGAVFASRVASRAMRTGADSALTGVSHQINFQIAAKLAEFRQSWINELRDCMAEVQSYGVTPDLDHARTRKFYKAATKIELLMNRRDSNFEAPQDCMYGFLTAQTTEEKFACNAPFIKVCQDILKTEWDVLKKELRQSNRLADAAGLRNSN
ncbi:MAG TPA: hypothetical protein VHX61_11440 [Rhizomicrobium sp.]|jgi:hypothetical protein|nr:hypothetical protein [Rhizomicrobium sp.]